MKCGALRTTTTPSAAASLAIVCVTEAKAVFGAHNGFELSCTFVVLSDCFFHYPIIYADWNSSWKHWTAL